MAYRACSTDTPVKVSLTDGFCHSSAPRIQTRRLNIRLDQDPERILETTAQRPKSWPGDPSDPARVARLTAGDIRASSPAFRPGLALILLINRPVDSQLRSESWWDAGQADAGAVATLVATALSPQCFTRRPLQPSAPIIMRPDQRHRGVSQIGPWMVQCLTRCGSGCFFATMINSFVSAGPGLFRNRVGSWASSLQPLATSSRIINLFPAVDRGSSLVWHVTAG